MIINFTNSVHTSLFQLRTILIFQLGTILVLIFLGPVPVAAPVTQDPAPEKDLAASGSGSDSGVEVTYAMVDEAKREDAEYESLQRSHSNGGLDEYPDATASGGMSAYELANGGVLNQLAGGVTSTAKGIWDLPMCCGHKPAAVEEKFEKYFGYLARCEGKLCTTTLKN